MYIYIYVYDIYIYMYVCMYTYNSATYLRDTYLGYKSLITMARRIDCKIISFSKVLCCKCSCDLDCPLVVAVNVSFTDLSVYCRWKQLEAGKSRNLMATEAVRLCACH